VQALASRLMLFKTKEASRDTFAGTLNAGEYRPQAGLFLQLSAGRFQWSLARFHLTTNRQPCLEPMVMDRQDFRVSAGVYSDGKCPAFFWRCHPPLLLHRLLRDLFPILEKLSETTIRERVPGKLEENGEWAGGNVRAHLGGF
jgi:hypothetical protein